MQDIASFAADSGITITQVEDIKGNTDLMAIVNASWTQNA